MIKEYCLCGSEVPIVAEDFVHGDTGDFVEGEYQCPECGNTYKSSDELMTLAEVNEYHGRV